MTKKKKITPHNPAGEQARSNAKKPPLRKKKKYYQAIEILSDPFDTRMDYEIIADLGLGHDALTRWRKRPHFRDRIAKRFEAKLNAVTPEVLRANIKMAILHNKEGFPDRRLYLEMAGKYQPKLKQEHSFDKESLDRIEKILRILAKQ